MRACVRACVSFCFVLFYFYFFILFYFIFFGGCTFLSLNNINVGHSCIYKR